jgi:hypothetical protein
MQPYDSDVKYATAIRAANPILGSSCASSIGISGGEQKANKIGFAENWGRWTHIKDMIFEGSFSEFKKSIVLNVRSVSAPTDGTHSVLREISPNKGRFNRIRQFSALA